MEKRFRILKISIACLLVALSLWAILLPPYFPSSSHAIVNTRKIAINSSGDGRINKLHVNTRSLLHKDEAVAVIEQDQVAIGREIEQLEFLQKRLEAQIANADAESARRKADLETAAIEFAKRKTGNIEALESDLMDLRHKCELERRQCEILREDEKRIQGLLEKGIVTRAKWLELGKLTLESEKRLQAANSETKRVENELESARAGLKLASSESNDALTAEVAAMQHEIRNLETERANLGLRLSETTTLLKTSKTHLQSALNLSIQSPANGMVWTRQCVEGQVVATGQTLVELADCNSIFVESFFHRHYEGSILPGDHAFVQLRSNRLLLSGRVVEVKAQEHGSDNIYVINSVAPSSAMLRVIIEVKDQKPLSVEQVGKLGKVVITSSKPGLINKSLVWLSLLLRNHS